MVLLWLLVLNLNLDGEHAVYGDDSAAPEPLACKTVRILKLNKFARGFQEMAVFIFRPNLKGGHTHFRHFKPEEVQLWPDV